MRRQLSFFHIDVTLSFENNEMVAPLFLDIQRAYDNVLSNILIEKLKSIDFPPLFLQFIYNLTHKRKLLINFDSINETLMVFKGLPQGSVLSPILYSLYVLELEKKDSDSPFIRVLQFADDVCLYAKNRDPNVAKSLLKKKTNDAACWLNNLVFPWHRIKVPSAYLVELPLSKKQYT